MAMTDTQTNRRLLGIRTIQDFRSLVKSGVNANCLMNAGLTRNLDGPIVHFVAYLVATRDENFTYECLEDLPIYDSGDDDPNENCVDQHDMLEISLKVRSGLIREFFRVYREQALLYMPRIIKDLLVLCDDYDESLEGLCDVKDFHPKLYSILRGAMWVNWEGATMIPRAVELLLKMLYNDVNHKGRYRKRVRKTRSRRQTVCRRPFNREKRHRIKTRRQKTPHRPIVNGPERYICKPEDFQ